jgi:hypothetical protein
VNAGGHLFEYVRGAWVERGNYTQVAVASSSAAAALDSAGNVYAWNGTSWTNTNQELAQVAITSGGTIFGIGSTGQVWMLPAGGSTWSIVSGSLRQIGMGTDLWGLNAQGKVYQYIGSGLQQMPGTF